MLSSRLSRSFRWLAWGCLATPALAATNFTWDAWRIADGPLDERSYLSVRADELAESTRERAGADKEKGVEHVALQARVTRRTMAKEGLSVARSPFVRWSEIEPGVYRVSARVAFDGDVGAIETPIELEIGNGVVAKSGTNLLTATRVGKPTAKSLYGCDVQEAGQYQVLSFLYEISPQTQGADARLKPRSTRTAYRWPNWPYTDAYPQATNAAPAASNAVDKVRPDGVYVRLHLPRTRGPCVRSVSVDWIKLERVALSPSIAVRYVRPQKIRVAPGDTNAFAVSLQNFTAQAWTRDLVLSLSHGLDARQEIHRQPVTLAAGESNTVTFAWATDAKTPLWGYEVQAEVRSGETVESSANDYFLVYPECYPVMLQSSRTRKVDPFRINETYINHVEDFGILPGDMAQVCPENGEEQWVLHMGDGSHAESYKLCRAAIAHNRAQGIASMLYLWSGGTGRAVMDLYVKRPEWLADRVAATDQVYEQLKQREDYVRQHDFESSPPAFEQPVFHVQAALNHVFPKMQEKIEKETLVFLRNTGYDGVRFDEGFFPPRSASTPFGEPIGFDMSKAVEYGAGQLQHFWDAMRAEFPRLELGANRDSYEYLNNEVGLRNRVPAPPNPEFVVFAKAGGLYIDEPSLEARAYGNPLNVLEDALWSMSQRRAAIRKLGGMYQLFSPNRDGTGHFTHDDIYWSVFIVASGNLYYGGFSPPPYSEGSLGAFVTRFAEFFRSKGLQPLEDAADKVVPDADQELWYAETAVWEDVGARRRYVVPFINPPLVERFMQSENNELPAPVPPFPVDVKIPEGYRSGEAWVLTWEPDVRAERLAAEVKGQTLRVAFPGLQLCRTLVVEFSK